MFGGYEMNSEILFFPAHPEPFLDIKRPHLEIL
jgi:hypothetical protein